MSFSPTIGQIAARGGITFVKPTSIGGQSLQRTVDSIVKGLQGLFKSQPLKNMPTSTLSKARIIRDVAVVTGVTTTAGFLTQGTGPQVVKDVIDVAETGLTTMQQIIEFLQKNPLLLAGGLIVIGLLAIRK